MEKGDVVKYGPTATVGKVTDIKEEDGRVWVKLDKTGLYYDQTTVQACDPSEYRTSSFKERSGTRSGLKPAAAGDTLGRLNEMEEEVDIGDITPGGAG